MEQGGGGTVACIIKLLIALALYHHYYRHQHDAYFEHRNGARSLARYNNNELRTPSSLSGRGAGDGGDDFEDDDDVG